MAINLYEELLNILPSEAILCDEPMCKHTTFKVGGKADYFVEINNLNQLSELMILLNTNNIKYFILGNGSNVIFTDDGYKGVVVHIAPSDGGVIIRGGVITVPASKLLTDIANVARDEELTGMEFASGIPGTIGGAVVMNAGAFDGEMKDIIKTVKVINKHGKIIKLDNQELDFKYRSSILKVIGCVAVEVEMGLEKGIKEEISDKMNSFLVRRREKQPLSSPSAGSTFKRPEGNFAGKLIMEAGLSGYSIGGASVSTKHCGFVVNDNNATSKDVCDLINHIQEVVLAKSGVRLEPEVVIVK